MKRFLVSVTCLIALSVAAIPVGAQTRARINDSNNGRRYDHRNFDNRVYQEQINRSRAASVYDNGYDNGGYYDGYYDNRSTWERSRDKITTAVGAGAGAVIGGLIGGKKGAIIGALAGGGGAALYTYKLRDKYPYR
ncbi:MAG TPA: hypothetical protein VKB46_20975 [Pyrinomonadaceae bacterium]|nr:hypothetical protein [Pyrinomonadaceae bacterium]